MFITPIPELIVVAIAVMSLMFCVYSFWKWNEYAAVGWIIPLVYFICLYLWIYMEQPNDEFRRFWNRIGLIITFSNIIIWRIYFILRQIKRHTLEKHNANQR